MWYNLNMIDFSIFKRWQVWLTITVSLIVILGITWFLTGSSGFPAAFPSALVAWGTLMLAIATIMMVISSRTQESQRRKDELAKEKRDRKESILNEIRDWIFSIKAITLEPITEENIAFRQLNIELKYGIPMSRVELLEIEIKKILKDQDLNEKVSKVAKLLAAIMVLDKARYESGNINENVIEAFPGYVNFIKEILGVINEEANKTGKSKEVVAYDMSQKYIKELNNAEAEVLDKIVSLKSDLLKP